MAAFPHEQRREPAQVDVHGTLRPLTRRQIDEAAQRKAAHEITRAGESAGLVAQTHIHVLAELPPRIPPDQLGLVAGGQILPRAEAVDHIGGVELLAVKPQPDQHVVGIVKSRVVSLRHVGTERVARETVTRREEDARTDRTNVARTPSPDVEALRLGQVGGVAVDQIILRLDVVVGDAQFVVGRQDELLAYADAQLAVVEIAARRKVGLVERPQEVGDVVRDDVASVAEIVAAEIGRNAQAVARAEDVGVGETDHRPALAVQRRIGADRPAVARTQRDHHARRVERIRCQLHRRIRDIGARTEQLEVAHQQLRSDRIPGFEEQVAPQHPLARHHVQFVARAFEPVAVGGEHRILRDDHLADPPAGVTFELPALVQHPSVGCRIEYGVDEEHPVEQTRYGTARRLRTDTVVETLVALFGLTAQAVIAPQRIPAFEIDAVAGQAQFQVLRFQADRIGTHSVAEVDTRRRLPRRNERRQQRQQQQPYATPGKHTSKDNDFSRRKSIVRYLFRPDSSESALQKRSQEPKKAVETAPSG